MPHVILIVLFSLMVAACSNSSSSPSSASLGPPDPSSVPLMPGLGSASGAPIAIEEPNSAVGALVTASPVWCESGVMTGYLPKIWATDPIYAGTNGKLQSIEYWPIVQGWSGSAWKDLAWGGVARGATDTTIGSTQIIDPWDRVAINQAGYYRFQYYIRWWNGYVKFDGTKVGVTSVIKTGKFDLPASAYRNISPNVIVIGGDPALAGTATGTPWCWYVAG
jgi:hypothetical protein